MLGFTTRDFEREVINKTNRSAGKVFPVIIDVDHPRFYPSLETCVSNNEKLATIGASSAPAPIKFLKKLPYYASTVTQLLKLYFIKPIDMEKIHGTVL
jgi:magnesium-protoporphyrin IX monomethyl ester (oxidative) cyclase